MDIRKLVGASRARLIADLTTAIERDAIDVVYQPLFACVDNTIVGAEALARWRHEDLGAIDPTDLIALASEAGLAPALSLRMRARGMMEARAWPARFGLALNVTPDDLAGAGFAAMILAELERSGLASTRLTLEITEHAPLVDLEHAAGQLRQLTRLGVKVALDDFGAGYCNFRYLKALPLAALKLDRSMVTEIADNPRDATVLRGLVAIAETYDLEVVAEGIESEAQLSVVRAEGCTRWQGFLGAEPMSAEAFARSFAMT